MKLPFGRPILPRVTRQGAIAVLAAALLVQMVYLPSLSTGGSNFTMASGENTVFGLMNGVRVDAGLKPLALHSTLQSLARNRSADMITRDYFSHTIPGCGCEVYTEYTKAGLKWTAGGENIAWNSGYPDSESPTRIHNAWMNSSGHRANILNPKWTHAAIGAVGADSVTWDGKLMNMRMYTQLFATLTSSTPATSSDPTFTRQFGADRYATAAAISAQTFAPGVPVVFIATGRNFPDALAGAPVAARDGGPVLLTETGSLPAPTVTELKRLRPARIVILGSSGVVSDRVASQLRSYSNNVTRIGGADRYATAAAISRNYFAPGVGSVYISTGANFPDALAGAPAAGRAKGPVLLVSTGSIPNVVASELARLRPGRIVILGSTGVVNDNVARALRSYSSNVTRIGGANRYATAAAISRASFSSASTVYIATGANFPDALAGGPPAARAAGPILLVPGSTLPAEVRSELARLRPTRVIYLGGASVVSDALSNLIRAAW